MTLRDHLGWLNGELHQRCWGLGGPSLRVSARPPAVLSQLDRRHLRSGTARTVSESGTGQMAQRLRQGGGAVVTIGPLLGRAAAGTSVLVAGASVSAGR